VAALRRHHCETEQSDNHLINFQAAVGVIDCLLNAWQDAGDFSLALKSGMQIKTPFTLSK